MAYLIAEAHGAQRVTGTVTLTVELFAVAWTHGTTGSLTYCDYFTHSPPMYFCPPETPTTTNPYYTASASASATASLASIQFRPHAS